MAPSWLEEHEILQKFIGYVKEYVGFVAHEIKNGNMEDALFWVNELKRIRNIYDLNHKSAIGLTVGSFAEGRRPANLNKTKSKDIGFARAQLQIVDKAYKDADELYELAKQGRKF